MYVCIVMQGRMALVDCVEFIYLAISVMFLCYTPMLHVRFCVS